LKAAAWEAQMLAEWAVFVAIAVSGFFIFHPLKDIAEHVWEIRLLMQAIARGNG
jgi:hypothetical protein